MHYTMNDDRRGPRQVVLDVLEERKCVLCDGITRIGRDKTRKGTRL